MLKKMIAWQGMFFFLNIISINQSIISGTEGPHIPQKPSYVYPDQNNPEKYRNHDQEILDKVLNTPVFYKDVLQLRDNRFNNLF